MKTCRPVKCSKWHFLPETNQAHTLADSSNRRIRQINHEVFYLSCAMNKCSRLESSFWKNREFLLPSRNIYSFLVTLFAHVCALYTDWAAQTATSVNQSSQCSQRILVQGQLEHVLYSHVGQYLMFLRLPLVFTVTSHVFECPLNK